MTACQGSPACRYAVANPPGELGQLINKLQSSITTYEKEQQHGNETFFTDRKYHSRNPRYDRRNGGRRHNHVSTHVSTSRYRDRVDPTKPCFICKKPGCRSWNHTPEEQAAEKARFRARNLHRFKNTNSRDFDKSFNSTYLQYVTEIEGEPDESGESSKDEDNLGGTTGAFAILLADTDNTEETGTSWFTSVESLLTAPTLVDDLNSLSLIY